MILFKLRHVILNYFFLFLQLIQFATNNPSCLASPLDDVWTNACPSNSKGSLEHLLFLVKQERNKISHRDETILNMSNAELATICSDLIRLLCDIIKETGRRTKQDQSAVDQICSKLVHDIEEIRDRNCIASFDKAEILKVIKKEDIEKTYLKELEASFANELSEYTPQTIVRNSDKTQISMKRLFLVCEKTQIIIINGEAGFGKTAFTKSVNLN